MDIFYVKQQLDALAIKVTQGNKLEQRQFLLKHPRRTIIEQQILKEIKQASLRMGPKFNRKKLDELITCGGQLFYNLAISAKIKELMTAAELKRHEQKAGEIADTQAFVDDMAKEAMSTAVTKAVPGLRDGKKTSLADEHRLADSRSDGTEVQSS